MYGLFHILLLPPTHTHTHTITHLQARITLVVGNSNGDGLEQEEEDGMMTLRVHPSRMQMGNFGGPIVKVHTQIPSLSPLSFLLLSPSLSLLLSLSFFFAHSGFYLFCLLFFSQEAHEFFVLLQDVGAAAGDGFCVLRPSSANPAPVEITADGTKVNSCVLTVRAAIHTSVSAEHGACTSRGLQLVLHPDPYPGGFSRNVVQLRDTSSERMKTRHVGVLETFPSATDTTTELYRLLSELQRKLRQLLVSAGVSTEPISNGLLNRTVQDAWIELLQVRLAGVYDQAEEEQEQG